MTVFEAMVLGAVQGLTEFLPVSSSGHLVITERLLGLHEPSLTYDIFLHFTTFLAVVIFFRTQILALRWKDLKLILIASIPAVAVALVLEDAISSLFSSVLLVGVALIATGFLNWFADRAMSKREVSSPEVSMKQAFIMGLFQAFALIPGISRSGSTVAGGILQGIERTKAFSFSFIMVLPLILGATGLQALDAWQSGELQQIALLPFLIGGFTAFGVGMGSLALFRYVIKSANFQWFAYYTWSIGVFAIVLSFWQG